MKPLGVMTIAENASDSKRIGPNTRTDKSNTIPVAYEELYQRIAPLPITYDISPLHPPYFSEFCYHDSMGGLVLSTLNEEINARVIQTSLDNCKDTSTKHIASLELALKDKYTLNTELSSPTVKKVLFYPGSNLLHVVDHNLIDKLIYENDDILIKPHPVTTDDGLKIMAKRYGYYRIIPPRESGIAYLIQAEQIYTPANSEIGLMAAILKKPFINVSNQQFYQKLTYAPIYLVLKDNNVEHNYAVLSRLLNSFTSGILMPSMESEAEERISKFCKLAMEHRQVFKSSWPWLGGTTPINAGSLPKKKE